MVITVARKDLMALFLLRTIDYNLVKDYVQQDKLLKSAIWETNSFVRAMLAT